jgi:uncharacterized MAPEG superfamily protein
MTAELAYLVWSAALAVILVVIAVLAATQQVGLMPLIGNREGLPELTGLAGRAQRAHRNLLESLVLFAILVLAAQVASRTNSITALGAAIFFWARIAHAVLYLAGIPWLRTAAWLVSIVGLFLIFWQLI